ncbi:methyltransferase domain-containing protein [Rhodophyticola sp. CCM32]|uniref:tRNA1(Val) (adenine(37)-N6)-methyltransferase n=1 Tax=Rhodophyticola sp. CCM32 TaxID=2916397 RepID=UPI00107FCE30|nr:methyltransferase [Rhodophyticola sp. CCM32]QBY02185.1 methyltransferase domain-containing protein [Rhodophyticola sp. CCM32]
MWAEDDLTQDAFLGGRVRAWQPRKGYRAGTDPVFLAAACTARPGDTVLELGCGAGVASLCLAARVPDLAITGVERQAGYADLARRNGLNVAEADLITLPADLRQRSFDHVIANPPYYPAGGGTKAGDAGREAALREDTALTDWVEIAGRRLAPKGWLTVIQAAERLPDLMAALSAAGFGAISLLPLASRTGRAAGRVLIKARKSGRAPFTLMAPFIMHDGSDHQSDGEDYTAPARAILRDGAALDWPGTGEMPTN